MYQQFLRITTRLLDRHAFQNDDELSLHMMSLVAGGFCLVVHAFLFFIFGLYRMPFLICLNAFSMAVYALIFYLIQKHHYISVGLIISAEVTLYATISGALNGIDNYIIGYYLLVVVMQVMVPYGGIRLRMGIILSIFACASGVLFFGVFGTVPMPFTGGLKQLLTIVNVYILLSGTMVELFTGNIVRSIIAQVNAERIEILSNQAHTDAMTGLYNRRYAAIYFGKLKQGGSDLPRCVAMLDIDDFKRINDSYGHACGDEVLKYLSSFLREHLRRSDVVFRWGGEEFLVVLENADEFVAFRIVEKIRAELAATDIPTSQGIRHVTVTIGTAVLDPNDPSGSIEKSDQNLYVGKRGTKNVTIVSQTAQ